MISPFNLNLTDSEISGLQQNLGDILRSGMLILGPHTKRFEAEYAEYVGTNHAVAVNSGTSALEILLTAADTKGKHVAVASNTNFASVAAIIRAGGEPVFMDMTAEYFVPDLDILKFTVDKYAVDGVLWVHIGGIINPDFLDVVEYCRQNSLFLIEDAAHAHGSALGGIKAGAFADGGAFSFFPTKVMTTMEGGMVTTDDADVAALARSLRNQGKRGGDYGGLHSDLGSSWRISEISACMGLVLLSKLDAMISHRADAVAQICPTLDELGNLGVTYCRTDHMDQASNYKFIVKLPEAMEVEKVRVIKAALREIGVECGGGVYDVPCHLQPIFQDIPRSTEELAITEALCPRQICPPITSGTTADDIATMKRALADVLR